MNLKAIFAVMVVLTLATPIRCDVIVNSITWRGTFYNLTSLKEKNPLVLAGRSSTHCVSKAIVFEWSYLTCFDQNACYLSDTKTKPLTVGLPGDSRCFMRESTDCFLDDGSSVSHDTPVDKCTDALYYMCQKGELVEIEVPPIATSCSGPFNHDSTLGCIYYDTSKKSWCDARKACVMLGSDLLSVSELPDFNYLQSFLLQTDNIIIAHVGHWNIGKQNYYNSTFGPKLTSGSPTWIQLNMDFPEGKEKVASYSVANGFGFTVAKLVGHYQFMQGGYICKVPGV